eukprot:gene9658-6910_t
MSADAVQAIKVKVDEYLAKVPVVNEQVEKIAHKLKVEKAYVAVSIVAVVFLLIVLIGGGDIVLDAIGFLYPAYCSIKAIESNNKDDDTQWLTYWLVFGLFKVVESVADFLISSIPFYFLIKLAFLVYLFLPQTQGAKVVYDNVIKVHLVPHLGITASSGKKSD